MTEQSIFELLIGSNQEYQDQINPLLIPDAVAKISSAIVHDTEVIGRNSSYSDHHWKNNLMLLHKLCIKDDAHQHVDSTNISTILNFLGKLFENRDTLESDIGDRWAEEVSIEVQKFKADIRKRLHEKEKEKVLMNEYWCKKVKELELSTGIEWSSPTPSKELKIDPFLFVNSFGSNDLTEQKMKTCQKDDMYRLKHIQFGYAIINLGTKCEISTHLIVLLKSLAGYEEMYNYEKSFCKHLFKYIDQHPNLLEFYCETFFFILEIQIIDACTTSITGTEDDFKTHLTEYVKTVDFKSLIAACKLSFSIYSKVRMVLYTLHYYSRLNLRIMHFLSEIEAAVKSS